jgi:hypothetical protein
MMQVDFVMCGHKRSSGEFHYSCTLRKGHEGKHYEAFQAWNDLGEPGTVGETEKRERALAERAQAGAGVTVHRLDDDGKIKETSKLSVKTSGRKRRNTQAPQAARVEDITTEANEPTGPIVPKLAQGEMVLVRLCEVIAFDHKNPRQLPLVERARRLMLDGTANAQNPHFCDLLEQVSDLYSSIPKVGLIEPFVVEPYSGSTHAWELKAGWRRMTALLILFGEECQVWAARTATTKNAALVSLVENISRKDMPWHLQAISFADLATEYSTKELHESTGVSVSAINNLIRIRNNLHPQIWEVVCKWGGTPKAMKQEPMLKLCAKNPDEQLETWRRMNEDKDAKGALPSHPAPTAQPVIDPADLLVQRAPTATVRPMHEKEQTDFLAVLRQAYAAHDGAKTRYRDGLQLALAAVEVVFGQTSADVEVLRNVLRQARTLQEGQTKRTHDKERRARSSATVAKQVPKRKARKAVPAKKSTPGKTPPGTKGGRNA